jgi:hypothetical protein
VSQSLLVSKRAYFHEKEVIKPRTWGEGGKEAINKQKIKIKIKIFAVSRQD